jgi:hypothetical protein
VQALQIACRRQGCAYMGKRSVDPCGKVVVPCCYSHFLGLEVIQLSIEMMMCTLPQIDASMHAHNYLWHSAATAK